MEGSKKTKSTWQDRMTWLFLAIYGVIVIGGMLMLPLMLSLISGNTPTLAWLAVPFAAASPWLNHAIFFLFPVGLYLGIYNLRKKKVAVGIILILCAFPTHIPGRSHKKISDEERQQRKNQQQERMTTYYYNELKIRSGKKMLVVGYKDFGCLILDTHYTACLYQPPGQVLSDEKRHEISAYLQNEFKGKRIHFDVKQLKEEDVFNGINPTINHSIFYGEIYYNDQKLNDLLK